MGIIEVLILISVTGIILFTLISYIKKRIRNKSKPAGRNICGHCPVCASASKCSEKKR